MVQLAGGLDNEQYIIKISRWASPLLLPCTLPHICWYRCSLYIIHCFILSHAQKIKNKAQITIINTEIARLHYRHQQTLAAPLRLLKCSQVQCKSMKYQMLADEKPFVRLSKMSLRQRKAPLCSVIENRTLWLMYVYAALLCLFFFFSLSSKLLAVRAVTIDAARSRALDE